MVIVNDKNYNHDEDNKIMKMIIILPWCWPPNDIKLTIGGSGHRWATARLKEMDSIKLIASLTGGLGWAEK